jgi:hypothetical protein
MVLVRVTLGVVVGAAGIVGVVGVGAGVVVVGLEVGDSLP